MTQTEAETIFRYRQTHGDFKTFDDLKMVPGLDVSKLEARKDRLAFLGS